MTPTRNPWPGALSALVVAFTATLAATMVYGIQHRSEVIVPTHRVRATSADGGEMAARRGILAGWHTESEYAEGILTVRVSDRAHAGVEGARVEVLILNVRGLPGEPHPLEESRPGTYVGSIPTQEGELRARMRIEKSDTVRTVSLLLAR